jgi:hypothetical protein
MRTALLTLCCALPLAACGGEAATPTAGSGETLLARAGASLLAIDTGSGEVRRTPAGAHDGDWSAVYAARVGTATTTVTATDPATGEKLREIEIEDHWSIPIAAGTTPEGSVSGDGRWLVLAAPQAQGVSEFALLDTALKTPPRRFPLQGRFDFDALSPDGSAIYLSRIETDGRYVVQAYDVAEQRLRPKVIVEKTSLGTIMQGVPVARAVDPTGAPVHTLYRGGPVGAFVHSLDTAQGNALCILLPRSRRAGVRWTLRLDRETNQLHAINPALDRHYLIDPVTASVIDAPAGAELPGTRLAGYAVEGDAVVAGTRTVAAVGNEAELLAVR